MHPEDKPEMWQIEVTKVFHHEGDVIDMFHEMYLIVICTLKLEGRNWEAVQPIYRLPEVLSG